MKLVMLLLVRDEIDIIGENLSFHLDHGVDHVVAIDNGSEDGTRDILDEFERAGVATVIDEPGRDYNQTKWTTHAAVYARDVQNADWIFSNDADEFWNAAHWSLKNELADSDAQILTCNRLNMVYPWDTSDEAHWLERLTFRANTPLPRPSLQNIYSDPIGVPFFYLSLPPKVMMRAKGLVRIAQGNHSAVYETPVVSKPSETEIFHYPVRTRAQLAKKVVQGGQAYEANTEIPVHAGWHWRRWYKMYKDRGIEAVLSDALPSETSLKSDLETGTAVFDDRFLKLHPRA